MGRFSFEIRCGKKHPRWIDALEQHFKYIVKANSGLTWLLLCVEMNEELQAMRKRSSVSRKTNFTAEICQDKDDYSIEIKRNQVTMAVIRFREN